MARAHPVETTLVSMNFSAAEKRMLTRRARDAGQTLAEYIRERVLAEAGCEEQIRRFLVDELTRTAENCRQAVAEKQEQAEANIEARQETPEAQRDRIVKEVQESLTQLELNALAKLFKPAFDAGLWPASPHLR